MSREQLRAMAEQMLDSDGDIPSAILSAKLEFRHRLIKLDSLQKIKITQSRETANRLLSKASLSARREERAEQNFRQASRSSENRQQLNNPRQIDNNRPGQGKYRKGMIR